MADRYWVPSGGASTGTWDASTTTYWSATSGGAGGASAPTSADDVFFDASSDAGGIFTVTIGTGAVCRDITVAGLDQVMTLAGSAAWSIYGSLAFPATNLTCTYTGIITFRATTTGKTVTTNGVTLGVAAAQNVIFDGVGGEWSFGSAITIGTGTNSAVRLTNGSLITNNFNLTSGRFLFDGATSKTITLGSSIVSLSGESALVAGALTTLSAGTSSIQCSSNGANFIGAGLTYNNLTFTGNGAGTAIITGANTFNNLTFTSPAVTGLRNISIGANQTVSGTLTLGTANTAIRRMFMFSDVIGTPRTITANAIATLADVDFRDIVAAGASGTWAGTRLGNCLGNGNITFDASKSVYRIGPGNWSDTQWALSSGGAVDVNNFPLAQDDAIFDANTTTGTHTLNTNWQVGGIDFSALTVAVTFATGTTTPTIYRNFVLDADVTITGTGVITFAGRATQNITSAAKTLTQPITINSPSGTVTLLDNTTVDTARTITHTSGTVDLNDKLFNVGLWSSTGALARSIDSGATGELHIAGATFTASGSNLTTTGTGLISMDSASAKTFAGGGFSYPAINQGGSGDLSVTGANTFANITNSVQPAIIKLPASTITNCADVNTAGDASNQLSLQSSSSGTKATINLTVADATTKYTTIKDIAVTGYKLNAYTQSGTADSIGNVNGGNDTGVNFTPIGGLFMVVL